MADVLESLLSGLRAVKATASTLARDIVESRPAGPLDERDPDFIRTTLPAYRLATQLYFRPKVRGLEHITAK